MEYIERIGGIEKKFIGTISEIVALKNSLTEKDNLPLKAGNWLYNGTTHQWECIGK